MNHLSENTACGLSPFPRAWQICSASCLRLLAIVLMLLDHLWATVIPGNMWMTFVGRLAFPIFAFQLVEGVLHTSNLPRYRRRLLLFALLSEVPFNLVMGGGPIFPFHQNVIFTLLLGFVVICALEDLRHGRGKPLRALLTFLGCSLLSIFGFVDYGFYGFLTILLFYLFRGFPLAWLCQLAGMVFIHGFLFEGMSIPVTIFGLSRMISNQSFAVFSLLPIWMYNGQKGQHSRLLQYGSYLFYPAHLLLLYLISALA